MKHTRRGNLPRVSSPDGIKARQELRVKSYERTPGNIIRGFRCPGSRNPRKVGR